MYTKTKVFKKNNSGSYNKPHSKRVAILVIFYMKIFNFFKIQSDQNIHQNAKFSRVAYASEPLAYMSANKL